MGIDPPSLDKTSSITQASSSSEVHGGTLNVTVLDPKGHTIINLETITIINLDVYN
ncbi:MAG: hypothetical protein QXK89_07490 [Candidatus Bathyarchaeia archaeon]